MSDPKEIRLITQTTKGKLIKVPATISVDKGRIEFLKSPYALKDEIKAMKGSKWHGYDDNNPRKIWSVADCTRNRFQLNFRNHRKIVVTDGRVAWVGGHNVGDEYLGKDPKFGHWRDTHVRIEGPAVLKAQISFMEDWYWATDTFPEVSWDVRPAPDGSDARVLIIPTGPADQLETCNLMFVHAINSATERIWIASPYFVPEHSVIVALQLAGLRGVDVRILIPDNPDHLSVYLAAYSYFDEAGQTGAKFYRYQDGFLHEKAMLVDDQVATIGTANFDNRSFRLNFEITAAIADPTFVGEVERMFEADFARSRLMQPGEYDRKPWYFRLGVRLARLTSPIQ